MEQTPFPPPLKPDTTYEAAKALVDIRVGTVTDAVRVPKSKKLIKLTVDFGTEVPPRVILTNLGEDWDVEHFLNKSFPFLLNIPPRAMMGIESHGMILATESKPGYPRPFPTDANAGAIVF